MKLSAALLAPVLLAALHPVPNPAIHPSSAAPFRLSSPDFADNGTIPVAHSCDGAGTSAALQWSGVPSQAQSLTLIMFDPDAHPPAGFVHWVVYDIPPTASGIPSGKYTQPQLPGGGTQGNNGRGRLGFMPSCPGPGTPHHYVLTLYALRSKLALPPGATRDQVLAAMRDKIIAQTELTGLYSRAPQ